MKLMENLFAIHVTLLLCLAEENTRQQSKRGFDGNVWGTVTNDKVELLFKEKWKKFFDPRKHCSACLFMKNNRVVKRFN